MLSLQGKLIQVYFDTGGHIVGAKITQCTTKRPPHFVAYALPQIYLKSRVSSLLPPKSATTTSSTKCYLVLAQVSEVWIPMRSSSSPVDLQ